MGLDISIKGLEWKDTYHCGYITFNVYRRKVASAYNKRLGELYEKTFIDNLQEKEIFEWNNLCNDDLEYNKKLLKDWSNILKGMGNRNYPYCYAIDRILTELERSDT